MSYRDDLEIGKHNLDEEWENQPLLFAKWAEEEVEAQFQRDKKKEQLELERAKIDSAIRKNPMAFGIDKVTEAAIQNVILQTKSYQKISNDYLDAVKNSKILSVARESFDQRKKALEKLTDLFLSNYWAEPNITREGKEKMEKVNQEEAQRSFQDSMVKRRRKLEASS